MTTNLNINLGFLRCKKVQLLETVNEDSRVLLGLFKGIIHRIAEWGIC